MPAKTDARSAATNKKDRTMILKIGRTAWFAAGVLSAAISAAPAAADDTELFIGTSTAVGAQPNILLIVDNSGSMAEDV